MTASILHDPDVVLTFNLVCLSARSFITLPRVDWIVEASLGRVERKSPMCGGVTPQKPGAPVLLGSLGWLHGTRSSFSPARASSADPSDTFWSCWLPCACSTNLCQVNPCPKKALSAGPSRALSSQRVKCAARAGFVPVADVFASLTFV